MRFYGQRQNNGRPGAEQPLPLAVPAWDGIHFGKTYVLARLVAGEDVVKTQRAVCEMLVELLRPDIYGGYNGFGQCDYSDIEHGWIIFD